MSRRRDRIVSRLEARENWGVLRGVGRRSEEGRDARGARSAAALLLAAAAAAALPGPARGDDAALGAAIRTALPDASPDLVEGLLADKVVLLPSRDDDAHGVRALVLFARPKDRVMQFLLQTARQDEYRPELARIERVEHFEDGDVDEQEMKIMLVRVHYRLRYHYDPAASRLSWALDPRFDNELEHIDGFWELHALDADHSLARFGTHVDVGAGLPTFLQDIATRKNVPQTLERCRRWIDSDGRYRP